MVRILYANDPGFEIVKRIIASQEKPAKPVLVVRKWTDRAGAELVEAELVMVENGNVILKKQDGEQITVPLTRLSDKDREFVHAVAKQENQLRLVVSLGHTEIHSVAFSPYGGYVLTGSQDETARLWGRERREKSSTSI